MFVLQVISAVALLYLISAELDCDPCVCRRGNCDIIEADCSVEIIEKLDEIPRNFSTNINSLNLYGQPLKVLKENVFQGANELKKLCLNKCQISEIHKNAFFNMGQLEYLEINYNVITYIDDKTFYWLINLKVLDLFENALKIIPNLQNSAELEELFLSRNNISYLAENTFVNNTKLMYLWMDSNKIEILPANIFKNLTDLTVIGLSRNRLSRIPDNIFINNHKLDSLHFEHNLIVEISATLFSNLTNLQKINLAHNKITQIPSQVFQNTSNLRHIFLNDNEIKDIPLNIFTNLSSLVHLDLSYNKIRTLRTGVFEYLKCGALDNLSGLEINLSNNNISFLPSGIFRKSCQNLNISFSSNSIYSVDSNAFSESKFGTLKLSHNKISAVSKNTFKIPIRILDLSFNTLTVLPEGIFNSVTDSLVLNNNHFKTISSKWFENNSIRNLQFSNNNIKYFDLNITNFMYLNLSENPIICDCTLRKQHQLYTKYSTIICSKPLFLNGLNWNNLSSDQFVCEPKLLDSFTETTESATYKIGCKVYGSPPPKITWIKNDEALKENDTNFIKTKTTLPDDVFWYNLSFSINASENFVGEYVCELNNSAGLATMNFTVLHLEKSTSHAHVGTAVGVTVIVLSLIALHIVLVGFYFKRLKRNVTNADSNVPYYAQIDETNVVM